MTRRVENRSSKVARKSKGLWRPTRLLHPLPRDSSSSFAAADFPLTRANPLGACNETTNIFSRIYWWSPHYKCVAEKSQSQLTDMKWQLPHPRIVSLSKGPLWHTSSWQLMATYPQAWHQPAWQGQANPPPLTPSGRQTSYYSLCHQCTILLHPQYMW